MLQYQVATNRWETPLTRLGWVLRRSRAILPATTAFAVAVVVLSQGLTAPFAGVQEPLQAQWIQDILWHGHWLLSRDYYGFINLKPPLFFWLSAVLTRCNGGHVTEPGSRIVSLSAGAALATEVFLWTRAHVGRAAGWFAYGVLLGSYGFASFATVNITDMLMSFLLFTAYCILYPLIGKIRLANRAAIAGFVIGLAILTKGPVALLLCIIAITLFLVLSRENLFAALRWRWPWEVLTVAIIVAAPWYVAATLQYGKEFTNALVAENLGHALRIASTAGTGAAHGWTYIPLRLVRAALPLVFMLVPLSLAALVGCIDSAVRKPLLFHLAMVIAVVLFFSAAHSVQAYYILPALPSLAVLISGVFAMPAGQGSAKQTFAVRFRDVSLAAVSLTLLGLIIVSWWYCASGRSLNALKMRFASNDDWLLAHFYYQGVVHLQYQFLILALIVGIGVALSMGGLISRASMFTAFGAALASIAAVSFWTGTMRTELNETLTIKPFVASVRRRVGGMPLYSATQNYELTFYYGCALPLYRRPPVSDMFGHGDFPLELLRPFKESSSPEYIILRQKEELLLPPADRHRLRFVLSSENGVFRNPRLFLSNGF